MDTEKDKERERDSEQDGLGIAQSALMCLDILAKYLGSSPNWTLTLADTLKEVVSFSSLVIGSIQSTDILRKSVPVVPPVTPSKSSKKSKKALTEHTDSDVASVEVSAAAIAAARQSYPELLKLQGSVFLSSGTICGAVGPRGLPFLAVK
jgi:hypothetical protein